MWVSRVWVSVGGTIAFACSAFVCDHTTQFALPLQHCNVLCQTIILLQYVIDQTCYLGCDPITWWLFIRAMRRLILKFLAVFAPRIESTNSRSVGLISCHSRAGFLHTLKALERINWKLICNLEADFVGVYVPLWTHSWCEWELLHADLTVPSSLWQLRH